MLGGIGNVVNVIGTVMITVLTGAIGFFIADATKDTTQVSSVWVLTLLFFIIGFCIGKLHRHRDHCQLRRPVR